MNEIFYKDSRNMAEIKSESVNLIVTSPPYIEENWLCLNDPIFDLSHTIDYLCERLESIDGWVLNYGRGGD